ncbi:SDR family oxidoreductase [Variovorax sp. efr-133-TYG-130]|uniref:SDR family oxidoreductase n=1 Tax=Variovorax sp. efr-133-TYG-130 TaxID=3040327 RepID=UPI002555BA42|nr:SDR family oxidoreductase [Variovorax sp. efr-133-TYG-130]
MDFELRDRQVFVTAGASGIGRAIAIAFAQAGARVHVCDIDAPALRSLAKEFPAISTDVCDVSDRSAVERTVASMHSQLGGLDVLVNNAGIGGETAPLERSDPEVWSKVLEVNLKGTFHVTQLCIPHLRASKSGVILNMSALAGRLGYPNRSAYSTTKWGLAGLTKTLAIELGDSGIRVNAILPGAVNGDRFQNVLKGRASQSGRSIAQETALAMQNMSIKKLVEPEQVAALAMFLASDVASTISGQLFPIDGDTQSIA